MRFSSSYTSLEKKRAGKKKKERDQKKNHAGAGALGFQAAHPPQRINPLLVTGMLIGVIRFAYAQSKLKIYKVDRPAKFE